MTFAGTPRPKRLPWHATTTLEHFLMVTYAVSLRALSETLPSQIEADRFVIDGEEVGLVSAVVFNDRDFRFRAARFLKMSCGQVNYRAYVTHKDQRGVYFFGTSLDSRLVVLPRILWAMPWHRDRISLDRTLSTLNFNASGWGWGSATLDIEKSADLAWPLPGFDSLDDTIEVLTHPMVGWYRRRRGIGRYSVWHPVMSLSQINLSSTALKPRFAVFEELGLIKSDANPHSILYLDSIDFDVHTPPRNVRQGHRT